VVTVQTAFVVLLACLDLDWPLLVGIPVAIVLKLKVRVCVASRLVNNFTMYRRVFTLLARLAEMPEETAEKQGHWMMRRHIPPGHAVRGHLNSLTATVQLSSGWTYLVIAPFNRPLIFVHLWLRLLRCDKVLEIPLGLVLCVDISFRFATLGSVLVLAVSELEVVVLLGACLYAHGSRYKLVAFVKQAVRLKVVATA
jgi:hypothetical protein